MRGLSNGAKNRYQNCTDADENSAYEGVPGERLTKNQSRKNGVEDETGLFSQRGCSCLEEIARTAWRVESTGSGRVVI